LWKVMVTVVTPIILAIIFVSGAVDYIVNGYGGMPPWYVGIAGWGMIGLLLVFSLGASYRAYRRPNADDEPADDTDTLAIEVQQDRDRLLTERAAKKGHL